MHLCVCVGIGGVRLTADWIHSLLYSRIPVLVCAVGCREMRVAQWNEMILIILILIALSGSVHPLICLRRGPGWSVKENVSEMKWKQMNPAENILPQQQHCSANEIAIAAESTSPNNQNLKERFQWCISKKKVISLHLASDNSPMQALTASTMWRYSMGTNLMFIYVFPLQALTYIMVLGRKWWDNVGQWQ